ncbi:MAG: amidohydrolase family protein [Chloroflexi bacterium]|nr:amidohydrolase family protein [Chloroflexota bacterium]
MTARGGATPEPADVLVRNAYVVTMDAQHRVYPAGAVAVTGSTIAAVGPDREVAPAFAAARTIDAHGAVVHPGFVDNHIHLCLHNMRWASDEFGDRSVRSGQSYWDLCVDETEYAGSVLASLEMARNGTTCFLEAGTLMTPDVGATAVEEIGIRAVLGDPFVFDIEGTGGPVTERLPFEPQRAFAVLGTELKRNSDPDALVRGHVNLRGMASATEELLLAAKGLADENGVVFNQHHGYTEVDAANDDRIRGRHPLVHFNEIGVLGANCTFAHMNVIRDDEVEPVIQSGMTVVWCPAASMLHGVGGTFRGRHAELYKMGANVALGSDSANWSTAFDIGDQMLLALLTARDKTQEVGVLTAEDVLTMATINGARAVGLDDRIGSLEVGKRADLVVRREDLPEAQPGLDPIRSMVHSSRSKSIDTVMVDGKVIVENGHSTRVDEEEVYARSREATRRLVEKWDSPPLSPRWPHIR